MRTVQLLALGVSCALSVACGSDSSSSKSTTGAGGTAGGASAIAAGASGTGTTVSGGSTNGGGSSLPGMAAAGDGSGGSPSSKPSAMPLISRDVPAFASGSSSTDVGPARSNDDMPTTAWVPDKLPAWIAYDLSGAPADQRQQVLIAFYAVHAGAYLLDNTSASDASPIDYTIEINAAAGGGMPPTDGWVNVVTETGNTRSARQYLANLDGGNWVRMSVTKSTNPGGASFDLDVHSAPDGASDSWLLMGDSITHISTVYAFSDLPSLVHARAADRWPAVISAAIGGTNTGDAITAIDETMKYFPGRFVVLAYGTNNHASDFAMEPLVQKVLAAGKIPAIPHIPWADTPGIQSDGPLMNQAIDALYVKYPQIFVGPDMWAAFLNRPDLIPSGDVHPNAAGQEVWRAQWAMSMAP